MHKLLILMLGLASPAFGKTWLLSAGSNESFDETLPRLDYAATDAEQFAEAMRTVAMDQDDHATVRTTPSREELLGELAAAEKSDAQKFIFYFSGHADERGLHLRDSLLSKEELHQSLEKIPARTKVVVLDSCYAGALAFKGVRPVSGTLQPKITLDEPSGSVFLTAASSKDMAVESRSLRGSLFTRSLVTGLYGEADANKDGVVTATELYEYAFRQTQLTSYMMPVATPQKPELIADLKGYGAVTLSVLAGKMGKLQLGEELAGKVAIQSLQGVSSFEVTKPRGALALVPVPAGSYRLWIKDGKRIGEAEVSVKGNQVASLESDAFQWRANETLAMAKGPTAEIRAESERMRPRFSFMGGSTIGASGYAVEASARRGAEEADASGLGVTYNWRNVSRSNAFGAGHETRSAVYLDQLWRLTSARRYGVGFGLETGLGFGVSRFDQIEHGEHYDDMPVDANVGYSAARIALKVGFFGSGVWLVISDEEALSKIPLPAEYKVRNWQTAGLGVTL